MIIALAVNSSTDNDHLSDLAGSVYQTLQEAGAGQHRLIPCHDRGYRPHHTTWPVPAARKSLVGHVCAPALLSEGPLLARETVVLRVISFGDLLAAPTLTTQKRFPSVPASTTNAASSGRSSRLAAHRG